MKKFLVYIPVAIVFIISSCSSIIQIPVKYPPELTITNENKTIVIINDFDISKLNLQNPKEIEVYISGVKNLINGLTDSISEDDKLKFTVCDTLTKIKADSIFSTDTFPGYKEFICRENSASNLLTINNLEIFFDQEDNYDDLEEDKVTSRDHYLGIRAGFELYSSNGKLIDNSNVEVLKLHKTRMVLTKWITIDPSVKKAGENVDLLSYAVGRKYRGKFYPSTDFVTRQYYKGKVFRESNKFIEKGDWGNARIVLLKMTESTNPKISQEKVAHNLSVANEALGY